MAEKTNVTTSQRIHQVVLYNVNLSSYKGSCNIHSRKNTGNNKNKNNKVIWVQDETLIAYSVGEIIASITFLHRNDFNPWDIIRFAAPESVCEKRKNGRRKKVRDT